MNKYKFTYFLNTACAERRPQTRRDLIEDWIVEEREYPTDLEAFEYIYKKVYNDDEDYLFDLYEDLPDQDDLTKINAIKEDFENVDISDGSTIVISIEGPGQTFDSGYTKEDFNDDYEEDDSDYDDEEYLDENKKLNEDYEDEDDYDLHEAAMECIWEGFDFAQEEFIDNSIKNIEDYEDIKDDYLDLEDFDEDEILEELYKIVTKQVSEDFELTKHIEVEDDGDECPYISGWCDEDIEIYDRGDLSEDELWATGWVGSVQNLSDGPFNTFEDIDISCFDNEKGGEYNLPDIPENIQKEFVEKVNKWIEENPDELDESKKLNEDEQLEIDEKGLPVLEKPYDIREREDSSYQITSSHPYDMTDYSYAISKNNDINSDWDVYDPENPRTIVSDYSARKTTLEGTYKGWNEALEAMKRIDLNKKRRIDRT